MAELSFENQYFSFDGQSYSFAGPFANTLTVSDDDMELSIGEEVQIGSAIYTYEGLALIGPSGSAEGIVLSQGGFMIILSDEDLGSGMFGIDAVTPFEFCFCAGTRIRTPKGEVAVETLQAGDLVETVDNGAQPVRWIGATRVSMAAILAAPERGPIRIAAGTFGATRPLLVSPHHRVQVTGWRSAALTVGPALAAASDLVDGARVARMPPAAVTYWHLMFDRHELVWSDGAISESLHPAEAAKTPTLARQMAELRQLFPWIDWSDTPVRPCLQAGEARCV